MVEQEKERVNHVKLQSPGTFDKKEDQWIKKKSIVSEKLCFDGKTKENSVSSP